MKKSMMSKFFATGLAVALLTAFVGCGARPAAEGTAAGGESRTAAGAIWLSVNPEIKVEYDDRGLVLEIEGVNTDGKAVVSGCQDYVGRECAAVVNELVKEIYAGGYFATQLDGHDKNIVIKLEDGSAYPSEDFLAAVAEGVREAVGGFDVSSSTVVVDEDDLDEEGRIGVEKAREIVLTQLEIDNAVFSEGEYDLDDGVYELEFTADGVEYEYELDAVTGKVLEADREQNDDWATWDQDDDDDWDDIDDMDDHQDDMDDDDSDMDDDDSDVDDDDDDR